MDKFKPNPEKWEVQKEQIKRFIYNPDERKVLGRTGKSWLRITVFYHFFFALLAAFSYTCYQVFATTLTYPEDGGAPKWKQSEGLIGENPGMGYRPMGEDHDYAAIVVSNSDQSYWSKELTKFINLYEKKQNNSNVEDCSLQTKRDSTDNQTVCRVPLPLDSTSRGPCTAENKFGYMSGTPCVLVKLNKIFDWEPEPFGVTDNGSYDNGKLEMDLEDSKMPKNLAEHIKSKVKEYLGDELQVLKTVWISCSEKRGKDQKEEGITGITYSGDLQGLPGYFYPYRNQPGYAAPFLMFQFNIPPGEIWNIECRAWAKNIVADKYYTNGKVNFQIYLK